MAKPGPASEMVALTVIDAELDQNLEGFALDELSNFFLAEGVNV